MPSRNTLTTCAKDTNIALTKAIQSIVKNQESFDKAVTDLNTLISDTFVKEYSYNAATKIIEERDEVAISKEVYENLKKSYKDLKKIKDDEIREGIDRFFPL